MKWMWLLVLSFAMPALGQTHAIKLTWNPGTPNGDPTVGYNIYRSPSGANNFQLLNVSGEVTATAYTDLAVQAGATYDYYVEAVDAQGNESGPSNTTTAAIPPLVLTSPFDFSGVTGDL